MAPGRDRRSLNVVGLFAGIGGIERGLHEAGHRTLLLCENDPSACAVLRARFDVDDVAQDVRELAGLPAETDLLVAGFPCQDLSQAGGTKGIRGKRSGLVGEVFRLLEGQRVPLVLLENVSFMLQLQGGKAMGRICSELEDLGYRWAYRVIDTRAFGLPHRRKRVFMLASLDEDPAPYLFNGNNAPPVDDDHRGRACGFYWTEGTRGLGWAVDHVPTLKGGSTVGIPSPPAIWMPDGTIVTPDIRDAEALQGFPRGWTEPAEEVGRASLRWKLVGNAVSVPVASWLGERLARPDARRPWGKSGAELGRRWPSAALGGANEGRQVVDVSEWPVRRKARRLDEFLRHEPRPLSLRATAGFVRRLKASSLRYPADFLRALERHEVLQTERDRAASN